MMIKAIAAVWLLAGAAVAQPVVVSGTVPDEAARAALLARARTVFGAERVVDQLAVGKVAAPANWNAQVHKMIGPHLAAVSAGQLRIEGNAVSVRGDVPSEAQRRQVEADLAAGLNETWTLTNALRVKEQVIAIPRDRTVEFETGRAVLTEAGKAILDEVVTLMLERRFGKVNVIGHTDNQGGRERNLALSQARAETVKAYAIARGMAPGAIVASGEGPDRPVADNASAAGRASNRRIEFRVLE